MATPGVAALLGSAALLLPLNLASGVLTARLLGPADRGLFTSLSTWAIVLSLLATAGVLEGLLALGAKESGHSYVGDAGTSLGARVLVVLALAIAFLPLGVPAARGMRWQAGLVILLASSLAFCQALLLLVAKLRRSSLSRVLQPALFVVLLAVIRPHTFGDAFLVFLLSQLAALVAAIAMLGSDIWNAVPSRPRATFRRFVAVAQVTPAAALVASRADLLVLGVVLPARAFGNYAIAASIASILAILLSGITPLVVTRAASGTFSARRSAKAVLCFALVVVTALCAASFFAVPLVYGQSFDRAPVLLCLLGPGAVASAISAFCTAVLQGRGSPGAPSSLQLAAAILSPVVLWLAGNFGGSLAGAAASSGCSLLLAGALIFRTARHGRQLAANNPAPSLG